jgi:hypothetical protein
VPSNSQRARTALRRSSRDDTSMVVPLIDGKDCGSGQDTAAADVVNGDASIRQMITFRRPCTRQRCSLGAGRDCCGSGRSAWYCRVGVPGTTAVPHARAAVQRQRPSPSGVKPLASSRTQQWVLAALPTRTGPIPAGERPTKDHSGNANMGRGTIPRVVPCSRRCRGLIVTRLDNEEGQDQSALDEVPTPGVWVGRA